MRRLPRAGHDKVWSVSLLVPVGSVMGFAALAKEGTAALSAEQCAQYEEKLHRWELAQERLFDDLADAIEAEDRVEAYSALKRLHGGGAGVEGSEFELRRSEIRERRKALAEDQKKLSRMRRLEKATQMSDAELHDSYWSERQAIEQKVAAQLGAIAQLESEALAYAEKAIVAELPLIFEILSGGSATANDDYPDLDATSEVDSSGNG